ncbi:MAG TPA: glycosyltransferase family 10 [Flavobacteriales bacterium]|nr:glycosyltransferase family 10 [Flavobacteriales bacterium]
MDILAFGNYDLKTYFAQTPGGQGQWGELNFKTEGKECDILVVFNKPVADLNVKCRKGGRWLIIQEPPYEKNRYFTFYFRYFDIVISGFNVAGGYKSINDMALLTWHIGKNYDELSVIKKNDLNHKTDNVVWITSSANMNPGHAPRLNFLEALKQSDLPFEVYGRGIRPLNCKHDVMFPVKYAVAVENYSAHNYWTEKIADAYLGWCMPIYYGCKNIEKYFPEGSFLYIDIHNPKEAIAKIKDAIENNAWANNLDAIAEARDLVMNKYNFFPYVQNNLLKELGDQKINAFVPADPSSMRSRIKNFFINR